MMKRKPGSQAGRQPSSGQSDRRLLDSQFAEARAAAGETDPFSGFLLRNSSGQGDELNEVLHLIREYFDMEVAFIAEFVGDQHVFRYIDSCRENEIFYPGFTSRLGDSYCHRIVSGQIEGVICDARAHPVTGQLAATQDVNIGCHLGVPVVYPDGELFGTLCCFRSDPDYTLCERDRRFLTSFAEMAGRLLSNRQLDHSRIQQISERVSGLIQHDRLQVHYQPVVELDSKTVIGVEALARFPDYPQRETALWFYEAEQAGLGQDLELYAIRCAIRSLEPLPGPFYLGLNASPSLILNGSLEKTLREETLPCPVVIEITEHTPISDYAEFRYALSSLKLMGVKLAIDDVGAGFSSLQHILELDPDIIKLDITLVRNIHKDRIRHALARSLSVFAADIGCSIVAEGVEKQEELRCLRRLGVNRAQGYYLARPAAEGYGRVQFEL